MNLDKLNTLKNICNVESYILNNLKQYFSSTFFMLDIMLGSSQVSQVVKNPPTNAGNIRDVHLIPGSGKSPWGGQGNPLPHSCLENPMDRGAWWITVHRVAKSLTQLKRLSTHTCILTPCLEWVMTPHRCLFSLFEYILWEHRIWVKIQIYSIFVVTKYIEKRSTVFLIAEEFLLYLTY